MIRKLIAAGVVASVLGAGAIAYAADDPARPTLFAQEDGGTPPAEGPQAREEFRDRVRGRMQGAFAHDREGRGHFRHRAVHGDLIVPDGEGGWQEVAFDKGIVRSVTASGIVIDRPDGVTVELTINEATEFKGVEGADDIRTGERARTISKDGVATVIGQRPEGVGPAAQEEQPQVS